MIENPEVQEKAHQEIDRVIGQKRMPEIEDRESLPYVNAICKETMRWMPIVPFAVPHAVTEEDEYNGMRIPKGAMIIPNVWLVSLFGSYNLADGNSSGL